MSLKNALADAKRRWPQATHLRVAENTTLCNVGGDRTTASVWGQYVTDSPSEVGCPNCLEWMHA